MSYVGCHKVVQVAEPLLNFLLFLKTTCGKTKFTLSGKKP